MNEQIKKNYQDEGGPELHPNRVKYNGLDLREVVLLTIGVAVVVVIIGLAAFGG